MSKRKLCISPECILPEEAIKEVILKGWLQAQGWFVLGWHFHEECLNFFECLADDTGLNPSTIRPVIEITTCTR